MPPPVGNVLGCIYSSVCLFFFITVKVLNQVLSGPVGYQIQYLIIGRHFCVGSTPKIDNAENLSQYDPGC